MAEKKDIKELKELIHFISSLAQAIASSLEDGKIGLTDLFKFFSVLKSAGPAFQGMGSMREEIADLSEAEKQELRLLIEKDLDLENKLVEGWIEQALEAAIALLDLIPVFQKQA